MQVLLITIIYLPVEVLVLLKCLHHDPHEVQHTQQFTEPLLAEEPMLSLQLENAQGTALHGTNLHTHTHADTWAWTHKL